MEKPHCPICSDCAMRAELDTIAREFIEETFDRTEDLRVFGTPLPKKWRTVQ
jgi:hypothetical protein